MVARATRVSLTEAAHGRRSEQARADQGDVVTLKTNRGTGSVCYYQTKNRRCGGSGEPAPKKGESKGVNHTFGPTRGSGKAGATARPGMTRGKESKGCN